MHHAAPAHQPYKKLFTDIDPHYLCFYCYCWPTLTKTHAQISPEGFFLPFQASIFVGVSGKFSMAVKIFRLTRELSCVVRVATQSFQPTLSQKVWENFSNSSSKNFHIQHITFFFGRERSKRIIKVIDFSRRRTRTWKWLQFYKSQGKCNEMMSKDCKELRSRECDK